MFADYIKMAAKAAVLIIIIASVIALFTIVTIPDFNISLISDYLVVAYTFMTHWSPALITLLPIGITLLTLEVAIMGIEIAAVAWRWVFRVNE